MAVVARNRRSMLALASMGGNSQKLDLTQGNQTDFLPDFDGPYGRTVALHTPLVAVLDGPVEGHVAPTRPAIDVPAKWEFSANGTRTIFLQRGRGHDVSAENDFPAKGTRT